jgi:hypothetical protein
MNKTTKFLLITMCAGVILAGCQKPVQPVEKASDSIAIEENSSINSDDNGNLDVDAKAIGEASKALDVLVFAPEPTDSEEYMRGWLAGIFDAEGCTSNGLEICQIRRVNPDTWNKIRRYLAVFLVI